MSLLTAKYNRMNKKKTFVAYKTFYQFEKNNIWKEKRNQLFSCFAIMCIHLLMLCDSYLPFDLVFLNDSNLQSSHIPYLSCLYEYLILVKKSVFYFCFMYWCMDFKLFQDNHSFYCCDSNKTINFYNLQCLLTMRK